MTGPDPEVVAIEAVTEYLEGNTPEAQGRFLAWVLSRFFPDEAQKLEDSI